jgi:nucleoid DNA-binding protein
MPYSQLARALRYESDLDADACAAVLREFVRYVIQETRRGEPVHVPGLGVIRPSYRKGKRVVCNLPDSRLRGREFRVRLRVVPFLQASRELVREERF